MTTTLTGSTALVTGATAGIGRAIALQLAGLGAEVVVHGRSARRGAETVREIEKAGGKARFIAADLTNADDARRLAVQAGPVDILVNNAGIYKFSATADTDDAFFNEHVNVNLRAPYILVQQLVPSMAARGNGAVVNLWADEFGRCGVRVNAVAPGPTKTPGTAVTAGLAEGLAKLTTLGRAADPEEIANAVTFLSSPTASYINGAVLQVTGGQLAIAP